MHAYQRGRLGQVAHAGHAGGRVGHARGRVDHAGVWEGQEVREGQEVPEGQEVREKQDL